MSLSLLSIIALNGSSPTVDTVRLGYEACSAAWFSVVKYAGYGVALGCALEAPETFLIIRRWWLLKFRNVDEEDTIEDRKKWYAPAAALGLIFIVLGIIVETYAEGKVSDIDAMIRSHESDVISAAETKAADAEGRLGPLEKEAALLRNAEMPRTIDPSKFAATLSQFRETKFKYMSVCDFEPIAFTSMLVATLKDQAGWISSGTATCGAPIEPLSRPGIWIEYRTIPEREWSSNGQLLTHSAQERAAKLVPIRNAAYALARALSDTNVEAAVRPADTQLSETAGIAPMEGGVTIYVGLKRTPAMPADFRVILPKQ